MPRIAVITPYYKEPDDILLRCHHSVLRQTIACTHILVADGHPKSLFGESRNTMHITLPMANADNGNTPRALGGIIAESYGFDAVAYLDADNWYEPEHLDKALHEHNLTGNPLVSCKRRFYDFAGAPLVAEDADENANSHVDTSCWLIFRPAFSLLRAWLMPKQLGPVCDRIFLRKVLRRQISNNHDRPQNRRLQISVCRALSGRRGRNTRQCKSDDMGGDFHAAIAYLISLDGVIETTNALGFYPRIW